jgi:hypothetical protein
MRQVSARLRLVLAIVVAIVAAGQGLPGIVHALLGPPAHVCTCAAGGEHATCPVCNPRLAEPRPSREPAATGIPCGDRRVAVGSPGEMSTLLAPSARLVSAGEWTPAPHPERMVVEQLIREPATPPPRMVST